MYYCACILWGQTEPDTPQNDLKHINKINNMPVSRKVSAV